MCSGAILLYKIPRVVIGENETFKGEEDLLRSRGVEVVLLDNQECKDLMKKFISEKPDVRRHLDICLELQLIKSAHHGTFRSGMKTSGSPRPCNVIYMPFCLRAYSATMGTRNIGKTDGRLSIC